MDYNSWVIYSDDHESKYYFSFSLMAHGDGGVTLYDNDTDEAVNFREIRHWKTKKGTYVNILIPPHHKPSYLSVQLSDKARKQILEIKKMNPNEDATRHELNGIRLDRTNWEFTLNLRGLLLYLVGRSNSNSKTKLHQVLRNQILLEKIAPFLQYWEYFNKAGFPVVDVLSRIAFEYCGFLDHFAWDDDYLSREITKRYYKELSGYFRFIANDPVSKFRGKNIDTKTSQLLNKYRLTLLRLIQKWTEEELKTIKEDIQYYSTTVREMKLT
jgi:hypothetical protein